MKSSLLDVPPAGDTADENPSFQEGRYAAATSEVTRKRQQEEDMS
jgi:hypothetical protein